MCSHAVGSLPFSEADRQAVQEAEATPGLQSWLRVQIAKGLRTYPPAADSSPSSNSDQAPSKLSRATSSPAPFIHSPGLLPSPRDPPIGWGPLGTGKPGYSIWGCLGLHMGDGPWVLGLDVRTHPGLSEPRTIMAEERTRRVGVRGCPKDCTLCGAVRGMPGPSVARWGNGLLVP